jgi:hypothetical protein
MTTCTRCQGTGFLNIDQVDENTCVLSEEEGHEVILEWIKDNENHDVQVCDCCGDGEDWHGEIGCHYMGGDIIGEAGPYAYNGGLCECH